MCSVFLENYGSKLPLFSNIIGVNFGAPVNSSPLKYEPANKNMFLAIQILFEFGICFEIHLSECIQSCYTYVWQRGREVIKPRSIA
jgi:hypothetical protein